MRKPKYKTGDKVEVCGYLNTVIESVRYRDEYQQYEYSFKAPNGRFYTEIEDGIVLKKEADK